MDREVKIYRITGLMLISHDKLPQWRKFVKEVRAVKVEHALEKIYSELGSRHKLKRSNIKIINVEEIPPEEAKSKYIVDLDSIQYMVV
ncbi:MAG: 50S ribosomal protein L18Ae [Ignisphaera sp.]|uniref:Large ribosomal subunit protein eL20 n=1 Tax=Ignisphaera aggregans TaxID=334771 RepID=A0A7J3N0K5_9CREN